MDRPGKGSRDEHIDALFTCDIDWNLIATHARDMIQVVLSIQAGRGMPSMLLRKLGTDSRRSRLYRAFRELGRVERTLFRMRFFSSPEVRRGIRAETKIEAYNDYLDWCRSAARWSRAATPSGRKSSSSTPATSPTPSYCPTLPD